MVTSTWQREFGEDVKRSIKHVLLECRELLIVSVMVTRVDGSCLKTDEVYNFCSGVNSFDFLFLFFLNE